jgi:hypothetical protein
MDGSKDTTAGGLGRAFKGLWKDRNGQRGSGSRESLRIAAFRENAILDQPARAERDLPPFRGDFHDDRPAGRAGGRPGIPLNSPAGDGRSLDID